MCQATPTVTATFPKSLRSPGLARDFVEQNICAVHGTRAGVAAQLLASELVTNAVLYGAAPIRMEITCDVYSMRVEVHDESHAEADLTALDDGLGLLLVDKVAHEWGTTLTPTGKIVWSTIRTGFVPEQPSRPWQDGLDERTGQGRGARARQARSGLRAQAH